MLTFRMDETNFAQGERTALRILSGAGLKVDFDEFAPDGPALGLWHLHDGTCQGEGTGLQDASGNGRHLANYGAAAVEDGYQFVRADGDWMEAAFPGQPQRAQLTLECWVHQWSMQPTTGWAYREIMDFYIDANNNIQVQAIRRDPATESRICARLYVGGTQVGWVMWQGTAVDALLASGGIWHIAVVLDAPSRFRLFVGGMLRMEDMTDIAALPAGDYILRLGRNYAANTIYDLDAILDEVRLSAAARYTAAFAPQRLLASGTFDSPTFDAVRRSADWVDLERLQTVPPGCALSWQVRAADETDLEGRPQALWQPYGGDPVDLPDGRSFQWRATLSASPDRQTSPVLESAEATASEAGYNLYHAAGPGPHTLAYDEPWARAGPGVTSAETDALDAGAVHWFGIRPVDADGRETPSAQDEVRLEIDAAGEREADRPAGPLAAAARPLPLGAALLRWRYRVGRDGVVPHVFRLFGDGGTGTIDYETPLGEVPFGPEQAWYAWTSGPLAPGVEHQLAVRAVTAAGAWDEQPAVARVTPDAAPPGPVDALEAETTP